ncbi:hypothetical protein Tco_1139757, partial [Tanacetum coccineum]
MDLVAYLSNEVAWFRSGEGSSGQYSRMTKLEFAKFSGEDVKGWLFRCQQFFKVNNVSDEEKSDIYKIFGPCYEDPMEEIKNLRQDGTIPDYQDKFEALMFKPKSLYDDYQLARMQETVKTLNTK